MNDMQATATERPTSTEPDVARFSLLNLSAVERLLGALGLSAVLWLGVFWALLQ